MKAQIGFAVHDGARDARSFGVEAGEGETIVFGSQAPIEVHEKGVLPSHLLVLRHGGAWLVASVMDAAPAYLGQQPLPSSGWIPLPVPCQIRIGAARIDFFAVGGAQPQAPGPQMQAPMAQPTMGHPQMGHPQMGHPQMGHPQMGHPQMGHPQMGHPQMGHPQMGHPQMAQPQAAPAKQAAAPAPTSRTFVSEGSHAGPRPSLPKAKRDLLEETTVKPLEELQQLHLARRENSVASPAPVGPNAASTLAPPQAAPMNTTRTANGGVAAKAARRLREDWQKLSTAKRMMVPLAALLAIFVAARPSRAGDQALESGAGAALAAADSLDRASLPGMPVDGAATALQGPQGSGTPAALPAVLPSGKPTDAKADGKPEAKDKKKPSGPQGVLPSARTLPRRDAVPLSKRERQTFDKAIDATFAGDFGGAYALYEQLATAHPEAEEFRAAQRVLAAKVRAER